MKAIIRKERKDRYTKNKRLVKEERVLRMAQEKAIRLNLDVKVLEAEFRRR